MRVLLSNDDIRHWSDNLDWGVDDNGYLDIHNDDEIFASYPPGAWLGIEGPEPKQPTETYRFAMYKEKEIFHFIECSIGTQEMVTGEKMDSLIFLGENGQEIRRFSPMDWSIVFRRLESGYTVYQVNPLADKKFIKAGCLFAGEMMYAWQAENWTKREVL